MSCSINASPLAQALAPVMETPVVITRMMNNLEVMKSLAERKLVRFESFLDVLSCVLMFFFLLRIAKRWCSSSAVATV